MINEQLLEYITNQREAGMADEQIRQNLQSAGWREEDIEEGFKTIGEAGGDSPQTHQKMREEATDDRREAKQNQQQAETSSQQEPAGQEKDETKPTNEVEDAKSEDLESSNSDPYREPADGQDQTGSTSGPGEETNDGRGAESVVGEDPEPLRTMQEDERKAGREPTHQADTETEQPESVTTSQEGLPVKEEEKKTASQYRRPGAEDAETIKSQKASNENNTTKKAGQSENSEVQGKKDRKGSTSAETSNEQTMKSASESAKEKRSNKPKGQRPSETKTSDSTSQQSNRQSTKSQSTSKVKKQSQKRSSSRIQQARKSSSSSGIATAVLSILGLLVVGGGVAYAYLTYFQDGSADTNAQAVIQSLADAGTFQYRIGVRQQGAESASGQQLLVVEGAVDTQPTTEAQTYYTIRRPSNPNSTPVAGIASEFARFPQLDQRKQEAVRQSLFDQKFFSVGEFQTKQKLGATANTAGFTTNRFGITASPSQLTTSYSSLYETIFDSSIDQEVAGLLQDGLGGFTPEQGQLWVHPTSSVPYQITLIGSNSDDQDIQVNMQFKNHGESVSSPPSTYENRPFADGLMQAFGLGSQGNTDEQQSDEDTEDPDEVTDSGTDTTDSTSTAATTTQPDSDEPTATSSPGGAQPDNDEARIRRQDQLRINDIQQIIVALRVQASENDQPPSSLSDLADGDVLSTVPRDPQTGRQYQYTVTPSGDYHVGAVLRATEVEQLDNDADFNSANTSEGGFNGAANACGREGVQNALTCYDRTGSLNR